MVPFQHLEALLVRRRGPRALSGQHPVVIIDDDALVRDSLAFFFGHRYRLFICASAKEGADVINDETCAVILDVKMPLEDGFWACAEIRKKVPGIPLIFYSAYQDLRDPYAIINEFRPFAYVAKDDIQELEDKLGLAVKIHAKLVSDRKRSRSV